MFNNLSEGLVLVCFYAYGIVGALFTGYLIQQAYQSVRRNRRLKKMVDREVG